jgi:uncharacterized membrane protein
MQSMDTHKPIQVVWPVALVLITAAITWGSVRTETEQTSRAALENRIDIRAVKEKAAELDKKVALNEQSLDQIRLSVEDIKADTKTILTVLSTTPTPGE